MEAKSSPVKDWMIAHEQGMISCPHQPGGLLISREACLKRHAAALQERDDDPQDSNLFRLRFRKGLALCSKCDIGERLTRSTLDLPKRKSASAPLT